MELTLNSLAAGALAVTAGYLAARAIASLAKAAVRAIEDALDVDFDFDDYDDGEGTTQAPSPCVCGSTEHAAAKLAQVVAGAVLNNGVHGQMPIEAVFSYLDNDPLAVRMDLTLFVEIDDRVLGRDTQAWTFARDILDTAMSTDGRVAGEGDVTAQYDAKADVLTIFLTDGQGDRHAVYLSGDPVAEFLARSFEMVPAGTEVPDVDAALGRLLDGTWEK